MKREHLIASLFFLVTATFVYLFYEIMIPFFAPIAWAAVFVIIFFPLYEKLTIKVKSRGLSSILMCTLIVLLIIGPITYLLIALVNEAADAVAMVNKMYKEGRLDNILAFDLPLFDSAREKLSEYFDLSKTNIGDVIKDTINKVSGPILNQTSWIIANGAKAIFYFFLMVFTMYYFFKDGERVVAKMKRLMPLPSDQINSAFSQLRDVVYATMYGGVIVAVIQGIMGGVMFALVGISSPVFWGAVMAFMSILPIVGTFIIYIPAGLILIISGSYVKGFIVIGVGTLVISQVDNVIRPLLIAGRAQMHPLVLLFSIIGGIALFGLLGVVVGPLIAAVFVTLVRIIELRLHPDTDVVIVTEQD